MENFGLAEGKKIEYCAQDSAILTAIGFRPDAASRVDNQVKYSPAKKHDFCPLSCRTGRTVVH
jgi:hypothetical protein